MTLSHDDSTINIVPVLLLLLLLLSVAQSRRLRNQQKVLMTSTVDQSCGKVPKNETDFPVAKVSLWNR